MFVTLIGRMEFVPPKWYVRGEGSDTEELAEFAGRCCYQSFDRPNPATATNDGYIRNIIAQQHFSVFEHNTYAFYITGISRSLTHEFERHRHFGYSELSQRYVNRYHATSIVPPVIRDLKDLDLRRRLTSKLENVHDLTHDIYSEIFSALSDNGIGKKAARGAARAVLPEMTETRIVVSGNIRAFRDFFPKRISDKADQEIMELGKVVLGILKEEAPSAFHDFEVSDD